MEENSDLTCLKADPEAAVAEVAAADSEEETEVDQEEEASAEVSVAVADQEAEASEETEEEDSAEVSAAVAAEEATDHHTVHQPEEAYRSSKVKDKCCENKGKVPLLYIDDLTFSLFVGGLSNQDPREANCRFVPVPWMLVIIKL